MIYSLLIWLEGIRLDDVIEHGLKNLLMEPNPIRLGKVPRTGENPWGIRFLTMFHMSNDSHIFPTREQLEGKGYCLIGNRFIKDDEVWLPLYEGKMFMPYDHRFANVLVTQNIKRPGQPEIITENEHENPAIVPLPHFWVSIHEINSKLNISRYNWLLGFKNVTAPTNERNFLAIILPLSGVGNFIPLGLSDSQNRSHRSTLLLAVLNSNIFDYIVRQKMGNVNLNFFIENQIPVLPPSHYTSADLLFIVARVLELVYTAWDIKPFADDVWREADDALRAAIQKQWDENQVSTGGHLWQPPAWAEIATDGIPLPPFKWDEDRRAHIRAELDAYYARFYGLTEEELRYIFDPKDIYGDDFPGETFGVLKEKELRHYGEYRTHRLVLEAWQRVQ
jgi:hypothetical protein